MHTARRNAETVVKYTTAYPFRLPDSSMVCIYCADSYDDPATFREHMRTDHQHFIARMVSARVNEGFLKVDCTELSCRLCGDSLETLEQAAEHLVTVHGKSLDLSHDLGMHPFKIGKDLYACALCSEKFSTLPLLSKHTHRHYVKYTCETCGKTYATITSLQCHLRYSCGNGPNIKKCRKCKRVFGTVKERQEHLKGSNRCCQHVCNVCGQRFGTWNMKQNHLKEKHGKPARTYSCPECSTVFAGREKLRVHFKIAHTNDYVECSFCSKRFDSEKNLQNHIVIHTGERTFVCNVCSKSFPRKSTLQQHMWIHSEVKKHECKLCDRQFNQKVSWRTHMKSRHPELCDF